MNTPPIGPEDAFGDPDRPPLWTSFLTPLALLVGAAAIVVAIVLTDDDSDSAPTSTAEVEALASSARSLATAAEDLAAAAEDLSAAAGRLPAVGDGAAAAPRVPTTLRQAIDGYADVLGLDADQFGECLASSSAIQAVSDQLQVGLDLGVNGTPSFFINNKFISGAQPTEVFTEVIAAELAGSPDSISEYSAVIQALANREPPAFAIVPERPDIGGAYVEGNPDARVLVVEFSDFQCPFCLRWYAGTLPEIRALVGDDVAIAFLHFPLSQIHPNAVPVHIAAQCAGEQGMFWEMHDLLFEQQEVWGRLPNVN